MGSQPPKWEKGEYVAKVLEESAQQCREENYMNRLMGKKEDLGGDIFYLYVHSTGDISCDV